MSRYITFSDAVSSLRNGRPVEQWLRVRDEDGDRILEWLRIHRERADEFCVAHRTVFDEGSEDFFNIGEFQSYDPDVPFGERVYFSDPYEAVTFAVEMLGASRDRFVKNGMAQADYDELVAERGFPRRP